jgi:hypothetical protein
MIKLQEIVGLPTLQYHLDNKLTLSECIYRYSSDSFIQLFAEARQALRDGKITLNEQDMLLLETTDIGEYGMYEGQKVALDLPMEYQNPYQPILEDIAIYGSTYENVNIHDSYSDIRIEGDQTITTFTFIDKHGIGRQLRYFKGESIKLLWFDQEINKWTTDRLSSRYEDQRVMNTFAKILVKVILPKFNTFTFKAEDETRYRLFRALILNNLDQDKYTLDFDDETREIVVDKNYNLNEAEYRGKNVPLNKPKRGGSKKFVVYVKDPKSKNIRKVSFGGTTGLNVKIDEPGARSSFAARHQCDKKKDKTKPGYWACNIGRYWKSLGGSRNFSGYW